MEPEDLLQLCQRFPDVDALANAHGLLDVLSAQKLQLEEQIAAVSRKSPEKIRQLRDATLKVKTESQILHEKRFLLLQLLQQISTDNDLINQLVTTKRRLVRLETAREYVDAIAKAQNLSSRVRHLLEKNPVAALAEYDELRVLTIGVQRRGPSCETGFATLPGFPDLRTYVGDITSGAYENLKSKLSQKLERSLELLGWPAPVDSNTKQDDLTTFRKAFAQLLLLQHPPVPQGEPDVECPLLLPMEVMLRAPVLHFRYHFEGNRPTNRLEKPEWAFTRVLTVIREHAPFLCGPVQSLLDEEGFQVDAKNEFTRGLVTALMQKLRLDIPKLLSQPHLFSHAIKQTIEFDRALREVHLYVEPAGSGTGCVSIFTEQPEWFQQWVTMETIAVKEQFREVLDSDEAWEFAYGKLDDVEDLKPTQSAEATITILEAVTNLYKLLPNFSHQLAFFNDIQLALLEDYLQEIRTGVKRHLSTFNPINTPGAMLPNKSLQIEGICRYASSLIYVSDVLREWAAQPFFAEFWDQLVRQQMDQDALATISETVFDEVIEAYTAQIERIKDIIVQDVFKEFVEALWKYEKRRSWAPAHKVEVGTELEITPDLCPALDVLSHFLPVMHENLPSSIFRATMIELAGRVDEHLYSRLVLNGRFNQVGAAQLKLDMTKGMWGGVFKPWHRKPEAVFKRIRESLTVLMLPTESTAPGEPSLAHVVDAFIDRDESAIHNLRERLELHWLTDDDVEAVLNRTTAMDNLNTRI
ncbi:RAD50-interacting protein 1 [Gaertneriomyces sp. JEL0708]|nr:RAD50-interacting protein 1 [Gaertneriomyces sp. JEL0708]